MAAASALFNYLIFMLDMIYYFRPGSATVGLKRNEPETEKWNAVLWKRSFRQQTSHHGNYTNYVIVPSYAVKFFRMSKKKALLPQLFLSVEDEWNRVHNNITVYLRKNETKFWQNNYISKHVRSLAHHWTALSIYHLLTYNTFLVFFYL